MSSVAALIDALLASKDLSFESMEHILQENLPTAEEIIAISKAELPYGRTMLHLDDRVEVIIGCWPQGGWCDAHDHGKAIGIVYAYSGEIEHYRYEYHDGILDLVEHEKMRANESFRLEEGLIHALHNTSSQEPYIGLHIYSPPTSDVRVFDLKTGDIYHVTDDYPALIPKEKEKIVKHEKNIFAYQNSVHAKVD